MLENEAGIVNVCKLTRSSRNIIRQWRDSITTRSLPRMLNVNIALHHS